MEKEAATNISVKLALKINGMTIDEFQKEIEKLSHLLTEMKQLSIFQEEKDEPASTKNNRASLDNMPYIEAPEIHGGPYWAIRKAELSIGKGEGTD
ncbi:hypothetical protein [Murdochiella massiliensis]|uniref:hypothetical protein n=1 Tax=Murdochiella massiliensis TaxID=1673723 RepID=UPI00082A3707|nr:hypothetical protein [Murdochiella massiliensis]